MTQKAKPRANTLDKKRRIIEAALDCFTLHGVEATTIEMIKEASGMSVGSLYHHFGNKEKIAAAVFIQGMKAFGLLALTYLNNIPSNQRTAECGVKALVYANVDWITENPNWARFVFLHRASVSSGNAEETFQESVGNFYQALILWFAPFLTNATSPPISNELFSSLVSGPTHDYARHWLAGRYKTPLVHYKETLAEAAWLAVKGIIGNKHNPHQSV